MCSSKSKIPVWPFVVLSFFGGAYALLPYFVLWRPPPPNIDEDEIQKWPLNFLESKIPAGIHVTSLDFLLMSAFAPFWVYNDMTARKCLMIMDEAIWNLNISICDEGTNKKALPMLQVLKVPTINATSLE
ncbi:hypothetical protein QJS04_geneDACA006723 [Acorus gramineus]|uniref:Uncharacterized protein n=1 Tax=Acorus gramineus TaxID=55184 RepID=A0AAV9AZZ4_ACOGR|nr:hypothetical protein QJS04_geneDACA006723 [Acorus gramineus]